MTQLLAESQIAHDMSYYTYRCPICNFICRDKQIPGSNVPITSIGNYGENATPWPIEYADEMYSATSISFVAATATEPAKLTDSLNAFADKHFIGTMTIRVASTSTTNNGDYTIASRGVTRGEILLSTADSLTDEDASTAGTVTLSQLIYVPDESAGGCPLCHSRATR